MESFQLSNYIFIFPLIVYIAVCFGRIALKNGRNPILWGILSIIAPVNLIILGYWAFSDEKKELSIKMAFKE